MTKEGQSVDDEYENKTDLGKLFVAIKRSTVLTVLIVFLYHYQNFMVNQQSNGKKLSMPIFFGVYAIMIAIFFIIAKFTPIISQNVMFGVGLGVGSALVSKVI